ncbi:hypothetical protein C5Y96_19160 [Blastopirellula marina]|uniref:Cytochrome c domain-containing protein n=1 Tax=Blastopirellula marina TaxID=124 RepID=A0A2S8F666_9BACT|nr:MULTISPECIES: hypothetical protein [Pirellulaceae]PQO27647.1 hypothetical protein C5Y96_19160 [Blastopirellula marina]RCS48185.1 hypothetical protein DTL36_19190 [Bremerella cremea]
MFSLLVLEFVEMKRFMLVMIGLLSVTLLSGVAVADKGKDSKYSTEEIMKKGFKGGLVAKVAKGEASEEDQKLVIEMLESLAKNPPHKGSEESWKEKTSALLAAAKDTVEGKEGADAKLKKTMNCKACHDEHK